LLITVRDASDYRVTPPGELIVVESTLPALG